MDPNSSAAQHDVHETQLAALLGLARHEVSGIWGQTPVLILSRDPGAPWIRRGRATDLLNTAVSAIVGRSSEVLLKSEISNTASTRLQRILRDTDWIGGLEHVVFNTIDSTGSLSVLLADVTPPSQQAVVDLESALGDAIEKPVYLSIVGTVDLTPTKREVLDTVVVYQPLSHPDIASAWASRQGTAVGTKVKTEVQRHLDALRKGGLLLRKKDGTYVATLAGLAALGRSTSKSSSDVRRALVLGQRRR